MNRYGIPELIEQEIIKYCYSTISFFNDDFFSRSGVRKNAFLECIFDTACVKKSAMDEYRLNKDELQNCFQEVLLSSKLITDYINGKNAIAGISANNSLVFKQKIRTKLKIKENEIKD